MSAAPSCMLQLHSYLADHPVSYPGHTLQDCKSALADGVQHTPDSSELVCDVAVEDMT